VCRGHPAPSCDATMADLHCRLAMSTRHGAGAGKALPIIYMGVSSRGRYAGCDQLVAPRWL